MTDETPAAADKTAEPSAVTEISTASTNVPDTGSDPDPPAAHQDENGAPSDEPFDGEDIPADSLRVTSRVAEEMYGDQFDAEARERETRHYQTHGPANIGDNGKIFNVYHERLRKPKIRDLPYVPEMVDTYAGTDSDAGLDRALDQRFTACLTGPDDTGRYTTACAALARRRGATKVHEILLPLNEEAECIERHANLLVTGHGYVLRLPGNGHVRAMRLLDDTFRGRGASLILIKDADPRGEKGSGAEVIHRKPDPRKVFDRHLTKFLTKGTHTAPNEIGVYVARCHEWAGLPELLRRTYDPREVVAVAREVARRRPQDAATMTDVLAASQPRRRERAARALVPAANDERLAHHRTGQHERAFRIAYAAFCHQPLHDVFTATGWLLEEIDGESRRPDLGRLALEHPIADLLGPELRADWCDAREEAAPSPGTSRTAWLRDTKMRGAIIDVAWHEFDNTRPALIKWLARLVHEGERPMQAAAAEVAGLLASHDFDRVHDELIDRWAVSPRRAVRQAAARAATLAALKSQVAKLVRRRVREWVDSGSHRRDTALRVYASGLRQPHPGWNLVDLHRIAQDRLQRRSGLVAEAVNQLYAPEALGWLVSELVTWPRTASPARVGLAQAHAARSFLALASRSEDAGPLPEMLVRLSTAEVSVTDLVPLWQVALLDARSARTAWTRLGEWLRHAHSHEDLRKSVGNMLGELAQPPPLRRRLDFFLNHEWREPSGMPLWITTAMKG